MVKELYFLTEKKLRIRRDNQGRELRKARKTLPSPYPEDENLKFILLSIWQSCFCVQSIPLPDYMNTQLVHRDFKKVESIYLRAEIIL